MPSDRLSTQDAHLPRARRRYGATLRDAELERSFGVRALAGLAAGTVACVDPMLLGRHAPERIDDLVGGAVPLVVMSALCGLGALHQRTVLERGQSE